MLSGPSGPRVVSAVSIREIRLKWNSFHKDGSRNGPLSPAHVLAVVTRRKAELPPRDRKLMSHPCAVVA